jgi:hypothetical protein
MTIVSEYFKVHPCLAFLFVVGVCSVVAWYITGGLLFAMRWCMGLNTKGSLDWGTFFLGSTERLITVALVLLAPSYLPSFIGGWVALKVALGWKASLSNKDPTVDPVKVQQGGMLALIGNVLSFAIAIGVGWVLCPRS